MEDERLERRLRDDPSGDAYEPGAFLDRLASGRVADAGRARFRTRQPLGILMTAVAIVAGLAVLKPILMGPGGTATFVPSPSSRPPVVLDASNLQPIVDAWSRRNGQPSGSISFVGPTGQEITLLVGTGSAGPGPVVVRLGDGSATLVYMAAMLVATCSSSDQWDCVFPVQDGAFRLDDIVGRWYPEATIAGSTVRQVLSGTSGLAPIGPTVADLQSRIAANPAADWTRAALLNSALRSTPRFAPGTRREPVDAEAALLEDLIARATGRDAASWVDSGIITHIGLGATSVGAGTPGLLVPGHSVAGELADLDPILLGALGVSGGAASTSEDLARLGTIAWGAATIIPVDGIRMLTDAEGAHREPWGARAYCPCDSGAPAVILRTGHAVGWSNLTAYDLETSVSIGLGLDRDVDDGALESLIGDLTSAFRR